MRARNMWYAMRGAPVFEPCIELYVIDRDARARGVGIQMEHVPEGEEAPALTRLNMTEAQHLMDQLWDCGLRPTEGAGSAGALAATERHLADMQTIAFHALKVKGGQR